MSKKILVPLDGSPTAEQVLPHAVSCAGLLGQDCELILVRVLEPLHTAEGECSDYLGRVAAELAARGCMVRTRLARPDRVDDAILAVADEEQVDLILLCSHGRTGAERWFLGNVSERIIRRSAAPVLLVHADPDAPDWRQALVPRYRSLLLPLDGTPLADTALAFAQALPVQPERVSLVRADDIPVEVSENFLKPDVFKPYRDEIEQDLKARAARLTGTEVRCLVRPGMAWQAVVEEADERKPDLMVLATRARRGLSHLAFGSVAEKIARHASCPMLLLKEVHP